MRAHRCHRVSSRRAAAILALAGLLRPAAPALAQTAPVPSSKPTSKPSAAAEEPPIPGTGRLEGRVLREDGKTPAAGAVVRICSLESETAVGSAVGDARGQFHVEGLAQGFFEIVVTSGDEAFAANQVLQISPSERKTLDFVLVPGSEPPVAGGSAPRPSPCADRPPTGSAQVQARTGGSQFFHTKKGIAITAVAGAVALLLLTSGGGSNGETPASPSAP